MKKSVLGRGTVRRLALLGASVVLMGSGNGCAGAPRSTPSPTPTPTTPALDTEVTQGTRLAAQRALDVAERRLRRDDTAHYAVSWLTMGDSWQLATGDARLSDRSSRETIHGVDDESTWIEARSIAEDIWVRTSWKSWPKNCWVHASVPFLGAFGIKPLGLRPLLSPHALGFAAAGDSDQRMVVIRVGLADAAGFVAPVSLAETGVILPTDAVRAVVGIAGGRFRWMEMDAARIVDLLARRGSSTANALKKNAKKMKGPWKVRVAYTSFGAPVSVSAPEGVRIAEATVATTTADLPRLCSGAGGRIPAATRTSDSDIPHHQVDLLALAAHGPAERLHE